MFRPELGASSPPTAQVLAASRVKGIGPVKLNGLLQLAGARGQDLCDLILRARDPAARLSPAQVKQFSDLVDDSDAQVRDFEATGGFVLCVADARYPVQLRERLGSHAPPILFVRGNLRWLSLETVGFCGSRHASPVGLGVARDIADQLGSDGVVVVSGYAAGVDMAVHIAALDSGSATVVVLAEGIANFRLKSAYHEVWDWSRVVVVSEFLPEFPWSVRHAMQRNGTIAALSDAMVLIEARATGGSVAAGRVSLEHGIPLFAPVYRGMPEWATGNRLVLSEGASPVLREKATGRAYVAPIRSAISRSYQARDVNQVRQLSVFERRGSC